MGVRVEWGGRESLILGGWGILGKKSDYYNMEWGGGETHKVKLTSDLRGICDSTSRWYAKMCIFMGRFIQPILEH